MPSFEDSVSRWTAVQTRNKAATTSFVYGVLTTKIYCRPNCPSRLARRANVRFYDSPAQAEGAGLRACKRCRPNLRSGLDDPQRLAVEKVCSLIAREGPDEKLGVKALAKEVGLTESHFCRVFRKIVGMTIGEYRIQLSGNGNSGGLVSRSSPSSMDNKHDVLHFHHGLDEQPDGAFERPHSANYHSPISVMDQEHADFLDLNTSSRDISESTELKADFRKVALVISAKMLDSITDSNDDDLFQFFDFGE